jgi:DNA-binding NarL/FixJ family response regulator
MAEISRIKVVLVERNPLLANALQQSLRAHFCSYITRIQIPDEASLQKLSFNGSDLPVFVVDEPYSTIYQMLRLVAHRFPDSKRIVLGHGFEVSQLFSLILEGAHGFLTYQEVKRKLVRAILMVARGGLCLQPGKSEEVCLYLQQIWRSNNYSYLKFTRRQKQVIDLLHHKLSNKEIASQLCISENTVKFHLGKVFSKVGTRSRDSVPQLLKLTGT